MEGESAVHGRMRTAQKRTAEPITTGNSIECEKTQPSDALTGTHAILIADGSVGARSGHAGTISRWMKGEADLPSMAARPIELLRGTIAALSQGSS